MAASIAEVTQAISLDPEDLPYYNEYAELNQDQKVSVDPPVADNAIKISRNVETGAISLKTGANANTSLIEDVQKHLVKSAKSCIEGPEENPEEKAN
jgi:hypothetical protein